MEKERQLPTVEIEGTTFFVDVQSHALRLRDAPDSGIYLAYTEPSAQGYNFWYDKKTATLASANPRSPNTVWVEIKPLIELDPIGVSRKTGIPVDQLKGKTDFEVMVDQDVLQCRHNGVLPLINIAGNIFQVDYKEGVLRDLASDNPKDIDFTDLDIGYTNNENEIVFPYDPERKEISELDLTNTTRFPDHLICVAIPRLSTLDPVGFSRLHRVNETAQLLETGIRLSFVARNVPWSETSFGNAIKDNRTRERFLNKSRRGRKTKKL